jgi:hypothetical protein
MSNMVRLSHCKNRGFAVLYYKTFFSEYSGETPADVLQAVYADAKAGTGMSFDEWWDYQHDVWNLKYEIKVPAKDAPGAAKELLGILVEVGALEAVKNKKSSFMKAK